MDDQSFTTTDLVEGASNMTEADLAAALGEELPATEPEPAAEAPAQEEATAFVHQPTGKAFESELDLLRYESGYKDNKYGTELKEVKAKLEAYEALVKNAGDEPAPQQLTPEQQEQIVLKRALEGTGVNLEEVDAGAYKTIAKMVENMLGMYDGVAQQRFEKLQGTVEKITTQAQEAQAYNQAGIPVEQIRNVLEERPYLKQLAPGDRAAVVADLLKAQAPQQGTGESPNALRQALQTPSASDHVEGSASTQPPEEGDVLKEMEAKLDGNDSDFLKKLGLETARAPKPWDDDWGQA